MKAIVIWNWNYNQGGNLEDVSITEFTILDKYSLKKRDPFKKSIRKVFTMISYLFLWSWYPLRRINSQVEGKAGNSARAAELCHTTLSRQVHLFQFCSNFASAVILVKLVVTRSIKQWTLQQPRCCSCWALSLTGWTGPETVQPYHSFTLIRCCYHFFGSEINPHFS